MEAVERACYAVEAAVPEALLSPAVVVEALEERTHLTAFNAFISGPSSGTHGQNVNVYLWTTGQAATQWVVTWGDNHSNTYTAPPGGFAVPELESHQYSTANHYTITATATPTTGAAVSATYALNNSFGNVTNQGETVYNPNSGHNSAGKAIAIDTASTSSYKGDSYVTSIYNSDAAVTRFTPQGAVDTTFNTGSSTPGTFVLTGLGTGTPISIAVSQDGLYVAVAGSFNGWGVALIDPTFSSGKGQILWSKPGIVSSGQAQAVTFDGSDGDNVYAAGYTPCGSGTLMAAVELDNSTGNISSNFNGGSVLTFSTGGTCDVATAIVDLDEPAGGTPDWIAMAGYTTYSNGVDFTLAEITDSGKLENGGTGTDVNFGSGHGYVRTNFGTTMGSSNPSSDYAYALGFNGELFAAGYTNAVSGGNHVALGEWDYQNGTLVTAFGPNSDGLSVGPVGTANSLVINSTSGAIDVGGSYNNDLLVSQFTSGGVLDANNFGNGGNFLIDLGNTSSNSTDVGYGIGYETDSNGNILSIVIGGSTTPSGGNSQIALADVRLGFTINIT